jgi:GNAT superfamily N-acetyltransferase
MRSRARATGGRPRSKRERRPVKIQCFGCDAVIAGDAADSVADAFVVHGRERHSWSYPEEAVRNYARNYAEAVERLSGSVTRLSEIGRVIVHPVTEERVRDWLQLFDHDAFAGNPGWASCYCLEPHVPAPPEHPERPWRSARAATLERLRLGTTFGYLAYGDGRPAGWVNASLRSHYGLPALVGRGEPGSPSVIGVSCFVIAPPFRRHGVAAALLDRVIADAPARGAWWIEGYPHNQPEGSDAGHFRGPRSMYDARGFEPVEVRERDTVVRRPAGPPASSADGRRD